MQWMHYLRSLLKGLVLEKFSTLEPGNFQGVRENQEFLVHDISDSWLGNNGNDFPCNQGEFFSCTHFSSHCCAVLKNA